MNKKGGNLRSVVFSSIFYLLSLGIVESLGRNEIIIEPKLARPVNNKKYDAIIISRKLRMDAYYALFHFILLVFHLISSHPTSKNNNIVSFPFHSRGSALSRIVQTGLDGLSRLFFIVQKYQFLLTLWPVLPFPLFTIFL